MSPSNPSDATLAQPPSQAPAQNPRELTHQASRILHKLAHWAPHQPSLWIEAGEHDTLFREAAQSEGWPIAPQRAAAEVVCHYQPSERIENWDAWLSQFPRANTFYLATTTEIQTNKATARPLKIYRELNTTLAQHPAGKWLPTAARDWLGKLWRLFRFDDSVGARLAGFPDPQAKEIILAPQKDQSTHTQSDRFWHAAMTVGGVGNIAFFPGTFAALFTALFSIALWAVASPSIFYASHALLLIISSLLCYRAEKWAHRYFSTSDPREVVLDEVAGMALATLFIPAADLGWLSILIAFALFRFFDIFKVGVHWIERIPIPGTILWDDLLAGIYAGILLALGYAFIF